MSSRSRLVVYLVAVHGTFLALALLLYRDQPLWMIGIELGLLLSLGLGIRFVNRALAPLEHARRFHELLQDRNYAARLQDPDAHELAGLVGLFNGMLEALHQERLKLGEQRGFLERLLQATPSAVLVFDFDQRISLVNTSAATLLGLDDPVGKSLGDWPDNAGFAAGFDAMAQARSLGLLSQLESLAIGESRLVGDGDGRRYRVQRSQFFDRGFARDFLLLDELTEELESLEKATYEKLVRVLAHEVNNTVAATGSVLDSVRSYLARLADPGGDDFGAAIEAVMRRNSSLGEFIERFTRVVKMTEVERRPTDLQQVLDDVLQLYREPCRTRGVRIGWQRCDAVGLQSLDRNLIEQALINIVKNAMEAAEPGPGQPAATDAYVHVELANDAGRVRVSVIDSGDRLADVPSGQMFAPFFTTKKGGQGIGLLFVREVLNRHGIAYRLASTGHGETRFDAWLPAPA